MEGMRDPHAPAAALLAAALLLGPGCAEPTEAIWLEGAGFGWSAFNHRLSFWEVGVDDAAVRTALVGGTSTTEEEPVLPPGCDPETCWELPFWDEARLGARLVQVSTAEAAFGRGTAVLVATAAGDEATVTAELPARGHGEASAVLAGLRIDTDHPLRDGEACYDPRYGWHPRRIAVALGEATLAGDGRSVTVPVSAWFEAGVSLEGERQCIDEVVDQAQVALEVEVQVVVAEAEVEDLAVSHGASYAYGDGPMNPDPQPAPDPADRPLGTTLADPVLGWSAVDFRFHEGDPDGRGAYLRTVAFDARLADDVASGHATNYSPVSQLTGFEYSFAGTVRAVALDADVSRGLVRATLPVSLLDDGSALVTEIPYDLGGAGEPDVIEMPH